MNLITFAQTMTGELDKAVVSKPVTGFFADNAAALWAPKPC